jgi:hypothetical protein
MRKLIVILLTANLIGYGCVSVEQSVAVNNISKQTITEFSLKTASGSFHFVYGILPPNPYPEIAGAGITTGMRIKPNDICIATWLDTSGQRHEVRVDLSKQSGLGSHPNLLFIINQDGTITVSRLNE